MRKLVKIAIAVVVLLIVALVALYLAIDSVAKAGIEKGGTYALGVSTRVNGVGVSLLRGRFTMDRLEIDNPKGYRSALLAKSGRWTVDVKTGSLFGDTVVIPRIEVDGIEVNVERRPGGNNISDVIENVKRLSSGEKKEGRKLKIDSIVIRNVTAHVQVLAVGGDASVITVQVPLIELKNVGSESSGGVIVSDLVAQLFPAIVAGILEKGKGAIPVDLARDLTNSVADAAKALGKDAAKLIGQVGEDAAKLVGKTFDDVLKAGKGIGDKLPKLFPGEKK
jgi:hypothetical protein